MLMLMLFLVLAPDVYPDIVPDAAAGDDAVDATPDYDTPPAADDDDDGTNAPAASPLLFSGRVVWFVSKRWAPCCAPWRSG